ncbi:MAG: hypothetical protein L3J75_09190 [Methylococcaceae bacterium]|nr:hypothetical protein [Methylococcaceae bacterium]
MRILSTVLISFIFALLVGCSSGGEVSGRSIRSANKSVIRIKNRLPTEQRIEFEVSYWTLRDSIKNKEEFLDTVGGKTPEELIVLGKEIFQQRKNAGFKDYDQYNSWDQMIAKFTQDRIDQNKHRKRDPRDAGNSVLYKL